MYHYLFTNDLRISNLQDTLVKTGNAFVTDTVPSAQENKSENNNMMTLGFYFNLAKNTNCASECANGNVRNVVLNFIKKFQFPNPRTSESLDDCINDGITVAPMRLIVQVLYLMNMLYPGSAHLSREEILDFIFYNDGIAKTRTPNIPKLIEEIIEFRKNGVLPQSIEKNGANRNWKHEERQIREMTKVLTWSGCVSENEEQQLYIYHDKLTTDNKAALFDIMNCNEFWQPQRGLSYAQYRDEYQKYMDIDMSNSNNLEGLDVDLNKLKAMKNKEFILACLDIMKSYNLLTDEIIGILTDKEKCTVQCGFPSYAILLKVDLEQSYASQCYISGNNRYYPDNYPINEDLYYVSNNWYPDYRNNFLQWLMSILNLKQQKVVEIETGENIILYGVPGCGKSHKIKTEYCDNEDYMERVVFHPDYTYSDFIGQILPENDNGHISYPFIPGPFTRVLTKAEADPDNNYYLIIEELNRGNAPAIFGEVFQLLDRVDGVSEYGISNADIALKVYGDADHQVRLPKNLFILATMNTADQNVFTLDTAFKRRWKMRSITNDINGCFFGGHPICNSTISWKSFLKTINDKIIELGEGSIGSEDKRLGAYFVQPGELSDIDAFAEKVLMYLWNDAFKYEHEKIFKPQYKTLEQLIAGFKEISFAIFADGVMFDKTASLTDSIENNMNTEVGYQNKKITAFTLLNEEKKVSHFSDFVRESFKVLYSKYPNVIEKLAMENYTMTNTDKVFITKDKTQIRGNAESIGGNNDIFFDIKISADNCVRLIRTVLTECGLNPDMSLSISLSEGLENSNNG